MHLSGAINAKHCMLLLALAFYPMIYIGLNCAGMLSQKKAVYLSELDLMVFAGGMVILSFA